MGDFDQIKCIASLDSTLDRIKIITKLADKCVTLKDICKTILTQNSVQSFYCTFRFLFLIDENSIPNIGGIDFVGGRSKSI